MASLTFAPPLPDGTEPRVEGIRIWFEQPRHGWLFPHVELLGYAEFVCRASDVEMHYRAETRARVERSRSGSG